MSLDDAIVYKGWIKIHRKILKDPVYLEKPFDKGHAEIDIFLIAGFEDREYLEGYKITLVKRGQIWASLREWADRWGWTKDAVDSYLKILKERGTIKLENSNGKTLITVVNTEVYQSRSDSIQTASRQYPDSTTTEVRHDSDSIQTAPRHDTQTFLLEKKDKKNKNNKEKEEEKEKSPPLSSSGGDDPDDDFWDPEGWEIP